MKFRGWIEPIFPLLAGSLLSLAGCGSATDSLPRHSISGQVTLDGKPLDAGSITFDPVDVGQANAVTAGASISGGRYSIARADGLTPGVYRVSVLGAPETAEPASADTPPGAPVRTKTKPKPGIPAKYNANTTLQAEVKPDGSGSFDFPLTSK